MKALLGCPGVDLNLEDRGGCSLLSLITKASCEDVLEMLLDEANVDPDPGERGRQITLSRAAAGCSGD